MTMKLMKEIKTEQRSQWSNSAKVHLVKIFPGIKVKRTIIL